MIAAGANHRGESVADPISERPRIEKNRPAVAEAAPNRTRDHVPWRELGIPVLFEHEPITALVDQDSAIPAQSFGQQGHWRATDRQRCRMELYELEVRHPGTRADCHCQPVSRRLGRVGRVAPEPPNPPSRQHHLGSGIEDPATFSVHRHDSDNSAAVEHELEGQRIVVACYVPGLPSRTRERGNELGTGCVSGCVGDPIPAVGRFSAEGEAPVAPAIELGAEEEQLTDPAGPIGRHPAHDFGVAEVGTSGDGVPGVSDGRVVVSERRRHTPLREEARTTARERGLSDHQDLAPAGVDCGAEPGHSTTDDQHLCAADLVRVEMVSQHVLGPWSAPDLEHPLD
jgi:hypothetical protein